MMLGAKVKSKSGNDFDGNPRIVLNLFFLSLVSLPASVGRCSSFAGSALGIAEEPQMKISIAQFSFLFLLFAFFTSISAISPSLDWRSNFILGEENLGSWKGEISRGAQAPGPANNGPQSTLVLAAKRTNRPDILRGFKRYRDVIAIELFFLNFYLKSFMWAFMVVFDLYWIGIGEMLSVGFTGAFGFILAFLWLVSFGLALVVHYCCGWRINAKGNGSDHSERVSLIMLILFTCAAALHCTNPNNVTQYLTLAKTIKVAQVLLPSNVNDDIDKLNVDLNKAANDLKEKTSENSAKIKKVFNAVRSALITVAAVMLLLSLLGFFLSILGHQHAIHVFIVGGWLLVVITFMLCGVFVILNNAITDTCMAMGEWMDNPQSESALSNILPCVDQRTSNQTLIKSKEVVTNIVNVVNQFIYTYANANPSPTDLNYYNQSGPLMPPLCYPYDSNLQDRQCGSIEVSMENASVVWKNYVCTKSELGLCNNEGRVTQDTYTQLVAAVNESYALEHYTPPLLSLQNCNFVQDTFREIKTRYCHPLEHDLQMVDAGLGLISVGVMLCLVLWIFYANHPQREGVFVTLFSPIRKRQK
ncbi:hypothetical protein CK203_011669 [Vitis vinifera]|uniref:Uncharacterized protein n=1 Tax=Vitis vinifera TaxID=29760 RepID=A0A438JUN6_VITVI|nr:hypothetical protein CK203_011669 [Vitis vinifera]